jgi:DNA-binding NarL/FixJ family response regulator
MGDSTKPSVGPSTNPFNPDAIETVQPCASPGALRVLIADDYEAVRLGLCAMLKSVGIEVCGQAKNGEEAVEKSIQSRPDLIILDISMPGLGGIEAARQIRVFLPDVPILFFTMHNTPQLFAIAQSVGVQGFVTKDQMSVKLLEAVDALLHKQTFFSGAVLDRETLLSKEKPSPSAHEPVD